MQYVLEFQMIVTLRLRPAFYVSSKQNDLDGSPGLIGPDRPRQLEFHASDLTKLSELKTQLQEATAQWRCWLRCLRWNSGDPPKLFVVLLKDLRVAKHGNGRVLLAKLGVEWVDRASAFGGFWGFWNWK